MPKITEYVNDADNQCRRIELDSGQYWIFEFDERGNKIGQIGPRFETDEFETWIRCVYNDRNQVIWWCNSSGWWMSYDYDDFGRLIKYDDCRDQWVRYDRDDLGREIKRSFHTGSFQSNVYYQNTNICITITTYDSTSQKTTNYVMSDEELQERLKK